jgi:tRNA (adenine22-N1)-methyltransferase
MLSKRLNAITNLLKKDKNVIIDVGCDHCYVAIDALKNHNTTFAYNVDINQAPLESGIKNLTKHNLIKKTKNIVGDGLNIMGVNKPIDYCIISGLGGNKITNIIENSKINTIDTYIVVSNNHDEVIRKFIKKNKYKIIYETIIVENNKYYHLIEFNKKKGLALKTEQDILFGPINIRDKTPIFIKYLKTLLKKYEKMYLLSKKTEFKKQIDLINQLFV